MRQTKALGAILAITTALLAVTGHGAVAQERVAAKRIQANVSPTKLVVRQQSTVSGKIVPATMTPTVVLQRKVGSKWEDRASAKVDKATGAYSIGIQPSGTGIYSMRVRSAGGTVISNTISVQVFAGLRVISGDGDLRPSARIPFAGRYSVVASLPSKTCDYRIELVGIPGDINTSFPLGMSGITMKQDMNFPAMTYAFSADTSPNTGCPWSVSFYKY